MSATASRNAAREKRHERIRLHLEGTTARPRLAVFRSLSHIYAQVIDDSSGRTLADLEISGPAFVVTAKLKPCPAVAPP